MKAIAEAIAEPLPCRTPMHESAAEESLLDRPARKERVIISELDYDDGVFLITPFLPYETTVEFAEFARSRYDTTVSRW